MEKIKKNALLKKGIWIKEQQGNLTIGSLDASDKSVVVIPAELSSKLSAFEDDMIEALYGEDRLLFDPSAIDIEKLLANVGKQFKETDLRISFSGENNSFFKGDYDKIYRLIERLVFSSLSGASQAPTPPLIHINASLLQDHLCIIYRDSGSFADPSMLENEMSVIRTVLNGEIDYKITSGNRSYFDIMIPSASLS